jgi:hypothetical protein
MLITALQFNHIKRNVQQKITGVAVGVIGGYHGANLGDMALGESVTTALKERHIKTGLQTIYNLSKWPAAPYAIVGGGAVGYEESLLKVAQRYRGRFERVALLGVDYNEKTYTGEGLELLKGAAFLSCRSKAQADKIAGLTGRTDIIHHPDIAFSLHREYCAAIRRSAQHQQHKKLLVNVLPLYGELENAVMVPMKQYEAERPELYANFQQMQTAYKNYIRGIVSNAIAEGYEVETIPFTPQDGVYGEFILAGLAVKHNSYNADPLQMIKLMATAGRVLSTRYHTTIFAIKLGIPIYPIAYAVKNELLLQDLGIAREAFLSTVDLANGREDLLPPVTADEKEVTAFEAKSKAAVDASIDALHIN